MNLLLTVFLTTPSFHEKVAHPGPDPLRVVGAALLCQEGQYMRGCLRAIGQHCNVRNPKFEVPAARRGSRMVEVFADGCGRQEGLRNGVLQEWALLIVDGPIGRDFRTRHLGDPPQGEIQERFRAEGLHPLTHALYLTVSAFQNNGLVMTPSSVMDFARSLGPCGGG